MTGEVDAAPRWPGWAPRPRPGSASTRSSPRALERAGHRPRRGRRLRRRARDAPGPPGRRPRARRRRPHGRRAGILAEIALDEADAATARAYAEEALAIAQPDPAMEAREALIMLARAEVVDGDLAGAATTLGAGVRRPPRRSVRPFAIAQCYRVAGVPRRGARQRGRGGAAVRRRAAARPSPSGTDDPVEADLPAGLETARVRPSARRRSRASGRWAPRCPHARVRELLQRRRGRRPATVPPDEPVVTDAGGST